MSLFPWSTTFHTAIRDGRLPWWDWHSFAGGYDLASDGVSGVAYPLHWLIWFLFDPALGHDVFMFLHVWLGGIAMTALLQRWRLPLGPSLLGGSIWMLAPFNAAWLQIEMVTPVLVVVPLLFYAIDGLIAEPGWKRTWLAGASLALSLVAGNLVVFLMVGWVAGLYALVLLVLLAIREGVNAARNRVVPLFGAGLIGLALSAFSLVPTLLNLASIGRATESLQTVKPAWVPLAQQLTQLWTPPALDSSAVLYDAAWMGKPVVALAALGLLARHRARIAGALLAMGFLLLQGTPALFELAWYALPPIRVVSGIGRLSFFVAFGMAILAALGAAVLLSGVTKALQFARAPRHVATATGALAVGATVLVVAETLIPFGRAVNPPWTDRDAKYFYPPTPAVNAIRKSDSAWPPLVLPLGGSPVDTDWSGAAFWGTTAHAANIDSVGGYDSAVPWRASSLVRMLQGTPPASATTPFGNSFLPIFSAQWSRLDIAHRAGVTHVYAPPDVRLEDSAYASSLASMTKTYEGPDGQVWQYKESPRGPYLVAGETWVNTAQNALNAFASPELNTQRSVVLERRKGSGTFTTERRSGSRPPGEVTETARSHDRLSVTVDASRRAWLVLPVGFSPGWRADVDGEPMHTRPANFAFTAVRVPPGRHDIELVYRPPGFRIGSVITAAAVIVLLCAGYVRSRPRPGLRSIWASIRGRWRTRHPAAPAR